MSDLALLAVMAAAFIFLFFVVRSLEKFWKFHFLPESEKPEKKTIRIGFVNPVTSEYVMERLEELSIQNPSCELCFFTGTADDLKEKKRKGELDIYFEMQETSSEKKGSFTEHASIGGCEISEEKLK